jgi:hypothetical protein
MNSTESDFKQNYIQINFNEINFWICFKYQLIYEINTIRRARGLTHKFGNFGHPFIFLGPIFLGSNSSVTELLFTHILCNILHFSCFINQS